MTRRATAVVMFVLINVWQIEPARAQSFQEEGDARALFQEGVRAVTDGSLPEAQRLFEASLRAEANIATVYNLAAVLERIGHPLRCRDLAQEALGGRYGSTGDRAEPFVRLLETCTNALARLSVSAPEGSAVEVDGRLRGAVGSGALLIDLDPGEHHVHVNINGREARRTIRIASSETHSLDFAAAPVDLAPSIDDETTTTTSVVEDTTDTPPATTTPSNKRVRRVLIVVAVLAAAAIGVGVALAVTGGEQSVVDPVWGNQRALITF